MAEGFDTKKRFIPAHRVTRLLEAARAFPFSAHGMTRPNAFGYLDVNFGDLPHDEFAQLAKDLGAPVEETVDIAPSCESSSASIRERLSRIIEVASGRFVRFEARSIRAVEASDLPLLRGEKKALNVRACARCGGHVVTTSDYLCAGCAGVSEDAKGGVG